MTVGLLMLVAVAALAYGATQHLGRRRAEKDLAEVRPQQSDALARLEEKAAQIERLEDQLATVQNERDEARTITEPELKKLAGLPETVVGLTGEAGRLADEHEKTRQEALGKAFGWAETIANPQSKGSFGEWAVYNQLVNMGLEEGRDFRRQDAAGSGRVDFSIHFGAAWALIDSKFAAERGLAEIPEALRNGDRAKLREWGGRLVGHANRLSAKEYWRRLDHAPAEAPEFTFMYVPVEGAGIALSAALEPKKLSPENFYRERRILLITPTSLPGVLLLIADLVNRHHRSDDAEAFRRKMSRGARVIVEFMELVAKHGGHLGTAYRSYDALLAAANGRVADDVMGPLVEFTGARVERPRFKPVDPPREDALQIAAKLDRKAAEIEMPGSQSGPKAA